MRSRFRISPEAKRDLREILLDVAEDSPEVAERLRREFQQGLTALAASTGIGHFHDELLSRKYRFWNFYSYVVAYVWEAKPIQIVAVVHGARDLRVFFDLRISE